MLQLHIAGKGECQRAQKIFPQGCNPNIVYKMGPGGDEYSEPDGMYIGGWTWHRELPVESAFKRKQKTLIDRCKKDVEYLFPLAKK